VTISVWNRFSIGVLICMTMLCVLSCDDMVQPEPVEPLLDVPMGFPAPAFPDDNLFTTERWHLGKRLFFDPILSSDYSISCASCHKPELGFSDDTALSLGVEDRVGTRNAPTLTNVAYHPYYTREGGVPTLEMQVLVPIQEHAEFDFNILLIVDRMLSDSTYVKQSLKAYNRKPDPFVITRAIATFERSLISGASRYDKFINGDLSALSMMERRGMSLFFSDRLLCASCHSGFNFTNYSFENNGLYDEYTDPGRFRLTNDEADRALFKVPTLRNVAFTRPYMHDGSFQSLEEVVDHYNSGGANHPHKSPSVKPLNLSSQEKEELVAFLKSLTDDHFITNPKFKN
jgi:cytochrome c peroxidase